MLSREKIQEKINIIQSHFDFKDFIGLSALIFGLLLSNSSLKKESDKKPADKNTKVEQSAKKSDDKTGQLMKADKKPVHPEKNRPQRKTASIEGKN